MKICKNCNIEKDITEYPKMGGRLCKICFNEYQRERNPKKIKEVINITIKICKKCNIEKDINDFPIGKAYKDGYRNICKKCINTEINNKKIKIIKTTKVCSVCNIEKDLIEYKKYTRKKCIDCYNTYNRLNTKKKRKKLSAEEKIIRKKETKQRNKESKRNWNINNKEYIKEYNKKENIKEYRKNYRKNNKNIINDYYVKRRKEDYLYKLTHNLRGRVIDELKKNGYIKKSRTHEIYGCSFEYLKNYIEKQFQPWMNWDNHGLYNGNYEYGWDIDHIIPLSNATNEEELIKLFHYTNLQPLDSKINRYEKRDSLTFS